MDVHLPSIGGQVSVGRGGVVNWMDGWIESPSGIVRHAPNVGFGKVSIAQYGAESCTAPSIRLKSKLMS